MWTAPLSRRMLLSRVSAALLVGLLPRPLRRAASHGYPGRPSPARHPEPRPGITAARVLTREQLQDHPKAISAFEQVRQIPQIVDGIECQCGCASREGYYSLLSCYEGEGMARMCEVCQGQGRLAYRLHQAGKTLDQIRAAIDARYGD